MIKKIFNFIFWILIIGLMAIWLIDFYHVNKEEKPQFCLNTKENVEVVNGENTFNVTKCSGLGYNIYYSKNFHSFQPFFINLEK